jgi:serine protease Do
MSTERLRLHSRYLGLLSVVAAVALALVWQRGGVIGQEAKKEVNPAAVRRAEELSEAFHNAAEVAMPSVVTVVSKVKAQPVGRARGNGGNGAKGENPFKGTPFEEFFNGRDFGEFGGRGLPRQGMGSGVIIDSSGIVLTNNHVVEGADEVTIHLADGREFKGEDIKTDDQTDLAVVRIKGAGSLPSIPLGDSDKMRIGDWVIAVGNPFEQERTVSAGIISGMGRELERGRNSSFRARFLQTDAAINPGNSGGPLVNLNGEVIGINTAIATSTGSFSGIGFAVPSNVVKWVTNQLINKGSVQRAYLGVSIGQVTPALAEKLGARRGEGVLINQVHPNTPASEAGFEDGDIVVEFAGQKVASPSDLQNLVERVPLDSKQEVKVLRDGKPHTLQVTAKALPKDFGQSSGIGRPERGGKSSQGFESDDLGLEVSELTAEHAEELGIKVDTGVMITKVDPDKPAYEEGLREGMVILKVAKKPVHNVAEFKAAIKDENLKDGVMLYVQTRNGKRYVVLK